LYAIKELPPDSDDFAEQFHGTICDWAIESLTQGAFIREYHQWETDAKSYFAAMRDRNGLVCSVKKRRDQSFVDYIKDEIVTFGLSTPGVIHLIDSARDIVNEMKHSGDVYVEVADYISLNQQVENFWLYLHENEEFTPPSR